jgi:hypothetical protein
MTASTPGSDLPRRLLHGRYRLVEELAHGGSAAVWRGYDERLARPVAVKFVERGSPAHVRREARSLALLTHPHVAAVYDYGGRSGEHFLITELVDGRSLATALAQGPLPWPQAVRCCAQIASALAAAHARGIVHRDVTPGNIMLTGTGAKLIDFGISAHAGDGEHDLDGEIRGTPPYAAPERLTGQPVAPPADVFALGVVLYRALTGRLPWHAATASDLLVALQTEEPAALPAVDGLPPRVRDACMSCLQRDPSARPTAAELDDQLQGALGGAGFHASPDPIPVTRAIPTQAMTRYLELPQRVTRSAAARWAVSGLVLAGMVGGATFLSQLGPARSAPPVAMDSPATTGPSCAVSYQVSILDSHRMMLRLEASNAGGPLPDGWRLSMRLGSALTERFVPGDGWLRTTGALFSPPQTALGSGGSTRLTMKATTGRATPLPTDFQLADRSCGATFLGATIVPTRIDSPTTSTYHQPARTGATKHGGGHHNQDKDEDG